MHQKSQPSLPSLHIVTNPNISSTKRIHARMIIEPNVKDILSLPKGQIRGSQFRRVPFKVNPKVVQAFSPFQSYSIIVSHEIILRVFVIYFMIKKTGKVTVKVEGEETIRKLKDVQHQEKIKYFSKEDENNQDIIDSIMCKVRMELGQQQQTNFITN